LGLLLDGLVVSVVSDFLFLVVFLGVVDDDVIGDGVLDSGSASGVEGQHNFDLNSHNSLLEEDVSGGDVQIVDLRLTGADHVTLLEFHGLRSLLLQLSGDDNLATFRLILHHSLDDAVGGQSEGNILKELELEGFDLGGGAETLVLDSLDGELNGVLGVVESLLDQEGQFSDLSAFQTNDVLSLGGLDSNFGLDGGNSDLNTGVTSGLEGLAQEGVEFGLEDTIGDEFLLFVDLLNILSHLPTSGFFFSFFLI